MNGLEDISGRTYAHTHGRDSLGLQRLRRETKNPLGTAPIQVLPNYQFSEKLDEWNRRYIFGWTDVQT